MECLAKYKAVLFLRKILSSKFLPFVSAAVVLLNYYLGWDVVSIWYFSLLGVGIMLTCKDVSPIFSVFMLMGLMVSEKNTPSIMEGFNTSDYYTRPYILSQMIVAIALLVGMAVVRIAESIICKRFKITPIFISLAVFVGVLFLNGIFSEYYTVMDIVFALFLAIVFLGIFSFACGNVRADEDTYERIAYCLLALLSVLAIELVVNYIKDGVIVNGEIERTRIRFGWGTYNNFGLYATICIPAPFYLAAKHKNGWIFSIVSFISLAVACFSMSRQVWLMGSIIYVVSAIWLLVCVKGRERIFNCIVFGAAAVTLAILLGAMHRQIFKLFSDLGNSFSTGSGRTELWREAMEKFLNYPVFGGGFYSRTLWVWGESGFANILPRMYHNTIVQLLECSGIVGFGAYFAHRATTVVSLFKNFTADRCFVAFVIAGILLTSLLDNHIFYLFPTIIYSMLLGVFTVAEKRDPAAETVKNYIKKNKEKEIHAA